MMYNPQRTLVRLFGGKSTVQPVRLVRWQLFLGGFLALEAVALLVLSVAYELPVYVSHLTGDTVQTKLTGRVVTAPALTELFRVNVPYLLAALLLVTALIALVFGTLYRNRYVAMLKKGSQPLRWLVVAVAGSLLIVTLSLLADVRDLGTLIMFVASVILASITALVLEQLPARRGQSRLLGRLTLGSAICLALTPLAVILLTMLATNIFGSVSTPGYVWGLYVTALAAMMFIGMNMYLTLRKRGKWSNYAYGECWFIVLIALIETAFVWQVFAAVLHP